MLRFLPALAAALLISPTHAQTQAREPWVRATVAQQKASGLFVQLRSTKGATLLGASSPVAGRVEIHEMKMDGDTMRMRQIEQLALPAGQAVELKPGGTHLMLLDLKQALKPDTQIPLTLQLRGADGKTESLTLQAPVRALGATHSH